jgi:hypothetical protein
LVGVFIGAGFQGSLVEAKFLGDGRTRLAFIVEPGYRQETKKLVDAAGIMLDIEVGRVNANGKRSR